MSDKDKWYTDWLYALVAGLVLTAMIIGNYYLHGGHIQW